MKNNHSENIAISDDSATRLDLSGLLHVRPYQQQTITQLHCLRCKGKPWWPRDSKPSFRCPHCHSKLWNVPPRIKLRKGFVEQGVTV